MIEKVNVRKLSQVQREACDLLRLFKRRAGWDVGRDIVYPIILKQDYNLETGQWVLENRGMIVIQPDLDWMQRLEDKLSTKGGV
jgi:hypothetical protein